MYYLSSVTKTTFKKILKEDVAVQMNLLSFSENQSDKITSGTAGVPDIIQMMHSHKHNQEKYLRNKRKNYNKMQVFQSSSKEKVFLI